MAKIVPNQKWRNTVTGQIVGWASALRGKDWELIQDGFTIAWPNGTQGFGRPPFATESDAIAFLRANPRMVTFRGMGDY